MGQGRLGGMHIPANWGTSTLNTSQWMDIFSFPEFPHSVPDSNKALSLRSFHKAPQLLDGPVIARRKLEHRLYAVKSKWSEVSEHSFNELGQNQPTPE